MNQNLKDVVAGDLVYWDSTVSRTYQLKKVERVTETQIILAFGVDGAIKTRYSKDDGREISSGGCRRERIFPVNDATNAMYQTQKAQQKLHKLRLYMEGVVRMRDLTMEQLQAIAQLLSIDISNVMEETNAQG